MIEAPFILNIWLTEVPEYSVTFLRIILWITIIDAVANPLMVAASASGKIKKYQSIIGGLLLSIVPIAYLVLKSGGNPASAFIVHLAICIIAFIARIYIVAPLTQISPSLFFKKVIMRCIYVGAASIIIPVTLYVSTADSVMRNILVILLSIFSVCVVAYYWGFDEKERLYLKDMIAKYKRKLI